MQLSTLFNITVSCQSKDSDFVAWTCGTNHHYCGVDNKVSQFNATKSKPLDQCHAERFAFCPVLLMHGFTHDFLRTRWIGFTTDGHSTTLGTGRDLHTVVKEICPDITKAVAQITKLEYFLARIFKTNNFFSDLKFKKFDLDLKCQLY